MALLLLDLQHNGLLIATIFFGLWLMPLGYLAYQSAGMLPKWLGALLIVGAASYLVDVLAQFLGPDLGERIATFVVIPAAVAEIATLGYLPVIRSEEHTSELQSQSNLVCRLLLEKKTRRCW